AYLEDLREILVERLSERGRLEWALEASEGVLRKGFDLAPAEEAWWKLKGRSRLRPRAAKIAQTLAASREARARALNIPPKRVLSDLALLAMAESPPEGIDDLAHIRGLDGGRRRGSGAEGMLAWARGGRAPPWGALAQTTHRPG